MIMAAARPRTITSPEPPALLFENKHFRPRCLKSWLTLVINVMLMICLQTRPDAHSQAQLIAVLITIACGTFLLGQIR